MDQINAHGASVNGNSYGHTEEEVLSYFQTLEFR